MTCITHSAEYGRNVDFSNWDKPRGGCLMFTDLQAAWTLGRVVQGAVMLQKPRDFKAQGEEGGCPRGPHLRSAFFSNGWSASVGRLLQAHL